MNWFTHEKPIHQLNHSIFILVQLTMRNAFLFVKGSGKLISDPKKTKTIPRCAASSDMKIEINKWYHSLGDEVLNWLGRFMIFLKWNMKRKVPFPHLLPLKEGGEEGAFLFILPIKTVMKYHNQLGISSWRSWWLLFVSFVMSEGAAQRSVCTLFFFFFFF